MGKRKLSEISADIYPSSPSDSVPCSSRRDPTPGETSFVPDDGCISKSHPSLKESMDSRGKKPKSQLSLGQHHHHHNFNRSMYFKSSRHRYGNQYSRRNSYNYRKSSTSHCKSVPLRDGFKLGSKYDSDFGHLSDFTDLRERAFWRPERIRSSTSGINAVSCGGVKMTCVLCEKSIRRKPFNLGSTLAPEKLSIVAVLVCGHIFHTDCLEHRTCLEDKRDPPCPICSGFIPKGDAT